MEIKLNEGEVLDDLQRDNLMIVQNKNKYRFSSDSVLLSNFAQTKSKDRVIELCSGSGVISILMNAKYHSKSFTGIELDKDLFAMAQKSLEYNDIKNITFINADLKDALNYCSRGVYEVVVCNPPYYLPPINLDNINKKYLNAKYELTTSIDEILKISSDLLKYSGKMYLIFLSSRLQELLSKGEKHSLICKKLQFINSKNKSSLVLVQFVKNGNPGCEILPTIDN